MSDIRKSQTTGVHEKDSKFGEGSVMIWSCMTWEGVGYAAKIDGRMDGDLPSDIEG